MNKYNNLLERISDEYAVSRGKSESQEQWKARLIYTVLGRMAAASLFDKEENENLSIIHMKRRIEKVLTSYLQMYPEIRPLYPVDMQEVSNEIYDIYLHAGVIYHEPNRVMLATKSEVTVNGIIFTRGGDIETKQKLSGLGTYMETAMNKNEGSLTDTFQLEEMSLLDQWDWCVKRAKWEELHTQQHIEYLRMSPPFNRGYWVNQYDVSGRVSLLRIGSNGIYLYYLYKVNAGRLYTSPLQQWQVEDLNYRVLANACICKEGNLPPSIYKEDGELVYFSFGYLPPPAEMYLWKLYTWPASVQRLPSDFNRICARKVFFAIRDVIQQKGYVFIEG